MNTSLKTYDERVKMADTVIRTKVINAAADLAPGQEDELFISLHDFIFSEHEMNGYKQGVGEIFDAIPPAVIDRPEIQFVSVPVFAAMVLFSRSRSFEFFNQEEH